jgi:sulfoxide reductase heme-binding subunit YedZ
MQLRINRIQIIALILGLLPFAILLFLFLTDNLTANPISSMIQKSGDFAILFLFLTLSCTPIYRLFRLNSILTIRAALGFFSMFYALVHFLSFAGLDYGFDFKFLVQQLFEKPFIAVGLATILLLLILLVTPFNLKSNNISKHPFQKRIHFLIYPAAVLAILHYFLASKGTYFIPLLYSFIFIFLMLLRGKWVLNRIAVQPFGILKQVDDFLVHPMKLHDSP